MDDPFAVLGVAPEAELEVIHAAHRTMAKKYHPDSNPGMSERELTAKTAQINAAHDELVGDLEGWRARVGKVRIQSAHVTSTRSAPSRPNQSGGGDAVSCPSCRRTIHAQGPAALKCAACRWQFTIDGMGAVVAGLPIHAVCRSCAARCSANWPGATDCPKCEWQFEIDASGRVTAGAPISTTCPTCERLCVVNCAGPVVCAGCYNEFATDNTGRIVRR